VRGLGEMKEKLEERETGLGGGVEKEVGNW